MNSLRKKIDRVYLHIDMDVHDAALAPTNQFKTEGGLSPSEVRHIIKKIADRFLIAGASITAFDPDVDPDKKGLDTGKKLIELICELAF